MRGYSRRHHKRSRAGKRCRRTLWGSGVADAGSYVCSVHDQGPGISAEDQLRLFQRSVRLSAMPTGEESSHGYGLAVAMELLGLIGGEIWCESELGAGSTFSFRLPAYVDGVSSGAAATSDAVPA